MYSIRMSSSKLGQGGFGCTYYPPISCNSKKCKINKNKTITKVESGDEESINHEIEIGQKIMEIPNYMNLYAPVIEYEKFDMKKVTKDIIESCDVIKGNRPMYALHIPLVDGYTFDHYFIDNKMRRNNSTLLKDFIFSYPVLVESIGLLNKYNIVHCDVKMQNIMYDVKMNSPKLIDFGLSLDVTEVDDDNLDFTFYTYMPSYSFWSPEYHVCCYLNKHKPTVIDSNLISSICTSIVNDNKILANICHVFKIDSSIFQEELYGALKKYRGDSYHSIIYDLMERSYHTWDLWSLHLNYMHILSYMSKSGGNPLIRELTSHFIRELTFDYNERLDSNELIEAFDEFLVTHEYKTESIKRTYETFSSLSQLREDTKDYVTSHRMKR
jgi:serine/threonine protein kinase